MDPELSLVGILLPLIAFLLILQLYFKNENKSTAHRSLPGPRFPLPIIGHLHLIGTKPHLTFQKWKKRYGPLYQFQMAGETTIVVNDLKLMKALLSLPVASGRPHSPYWQVYGHNRGILMSGGRVWEEQRAFAIKTLGELGFSKSGPLEGIIMDEALNMIKFFEKNVGIPITATRIFNGAVVSSLWTIVCGEKVEWLKETEITEQAAEVMMGINRGIQTGLSVLPWLRHFPPWNSIWKIYISNIRNFRKKIESVIEKRVGDLGDCNYGSKDYLDYFLSRIQTTNNPASTFYRDTGKLNMIQMASDLFVAGSITTSTTLEYSLMFLGSYHEVQDKLHREIITVIGSSRCPTLSDRDSMPYTQAVILEVLRRSTTAAATVHTMLENREFNGFYIPKGAQVLADIYSVLRDCEIWGEDEATFRPERHLNKYETEVVHHEALIPFAVGRRACIGEQLAKDTIFLFLTSIFQRFRVEVGKGTDFDNTETGFTLEPHPFEICVHYI